MDAETVYNETIANSGGTFSPNGRPVPTDGFMVSLKGHERKVSVGSFDYATVQQHIRDHADFWAVPAAYYLGTWVHEGYVYLDVSRHFTTLALALLAGKRWGQLAIYDLANNESIEV